MYEADNVGISFALPVCACVCARVRMCVHVCACVCACTRVRVSIPAQPILHVNYSQHDTVERESSGYILIVAQAATRC